MCGYTARMTSPAPLSGPSYGGTTRTDTKAVVALVLAVAAWTPTVPFIGAIAALVLAHLSERDIRSSGGALGGLGVLTATRVLAWVHLVFCAVVLLIVLAAVFGVFSLSLFGLRVG